MPFFFNCTNPCKTQKPESRTTVFPVPNCDFIKHNKVQTVLPIPSYSFSPKCRGRSLTSRRSTLQMTSLEQQPASCHSFQSFQGFICMYMNLGQVFSLSHFDIDSSIALIQLGRNSTSMLAFQALTPPRICPTTLVLICPCSSSPQVFPQSDQSKWSAFVDVHFF